MVKIGLVAAAKDGKQPADPEETAALFNELDLDSDGRMAAREVRHGHVTVT